MFELRVNPDHPVIYKTLHSEDTKMRVQAPPTKGLEADLRKAIGRGSQVDFNWTAKLYEISAKHIEVVSQYLIKRFGSCEMQITTSTVELCTGSCQGAISEPVECECVCGGHNHGGGWPEGWKLASQKGDLLVKGDRKTEIFTLTESDIVKTHTVRKPKVQCDPRGWEVKLRSYDVDNHPVGYVYEDGAVIVKGMLGRNAVGFPEGHEYAEWLTQQGAEID